MTTPSLFEKAEPIIAKQGDPGPGVLSVGVFTGQVQAAAPAKKEGWFARLKNLFSPKRQAAGGGPVQTEWSIDKVTVVRNDLFDDDLEVVLSGVNAASAAARKAEKQGGSPAKAKAKVANPELAGTLK